MTIDYTDPEAVRAMLQPPKDDDDRAQRAEGWKNFLGTVVKQMQGNPQVGEMLSAWGARMAQPIRPGETGISRASGALTAVQNLKAQQAEKAREMLQLGMDMRALDQTDDRLDVQRRGQDIQLQTTAADIASGAARSKADRKARAEEGKLDRKSRESVAAANRAQRERLAKTLSPDAQARLDAAKLNKQASMWKDSIEQAWEIEQRNAEDQDRPPNYQNVGPIAAYLRGEDSGARDPMVIARDAFQALPDDQKPAMVERLKVAYANLPAGEAQAKLAFIMGELKGVEAPPEVKPLEDEQVMDVATATPEEAAKALGGEVTGKELARKQVEALKPIRREAGEILGKLGNVHMRASMTSEERKEAYLGLQKVLPKLDAMDIESEGLKMRVGGLMETIRAAMEDLAREGFE